MESVANIPINTKPSLQREFEAALCMLLAIGFATLAFTGSLDLPTLLLVSAALLYRGYLIWQGRQALLPAFWTTSLTLGCAAFYLADYLLFSGSFLKATVHLVLFVMLIRLFSAQKDRDYYFLGVLAFLMLLASAALTIQAAFLAGLAAFTVTGVVTVILMEMRHTEKTSTTLAVSSRKTPRVQPVTASILRASPALAIAILLLGGVIFFLLPRNSSGYLRSYAANDSISTGFSDQVRLGRIGEIQRSDALVMHIEIDHDQTGTHDLKWRGVALNLFDGRTWSNPQTLHIVPRLPDGSFLLAPRATLRPPAIEYRVLMEPLNTNVFFLAPRARTIRGNFRLLAGDDADAVFDVDAEHPPNVYNATSDLGQPGVAELRQAHGVAPPDILLDDLQLPRLDARIPLLAEQIAASAGTNYDKAVAVESYLKSNFGYTLQLSSSVPRDPLAEFLFVRKRGHCEYFASSMAVMLRSLRIPARVVNGFRRGEFNQLTGEYVIRGRDAHSWVEAYFPGYGWITFDPTPSDGADGDLGRAALYLDALSSFWREWVINYDPAHQFSLAMNISHHGQLRWFDLQEWAREKYSAMLNATRAAQIGAMRAPGQWVAVAVVVFLFVALLRYSAAIAGAMGRWKKVARAQQAPSAAAAIWYERLLRRVAKRGLYKMPGQTPQEFIGSITDESLRHQIARFTAHYELARFGESVEDVLRLPELYAEIAHKG
jgi:transglutaminase-like putative cysteine protease